MNARLLLIAIGAETDIVLVRKRTRRLAELIGFDAQDQTRITTAVSEIARNAFEYAKGGQVEFRLIGETTPQVFSISVRDKGPGITDVSAILAGAHKSATGMGLGLLGARRLMDEFHIASRTGEGTTVRLGKSLPPRASLITVSALKAITEKLMADGPADALEEIRQQNQQILVQMDELKTRQEDLERLNQELQDTNRGVVALYAELDERADHLRRADELKSKFLSHMSHEFRTPLNSILALSRLLLDRSDGELTTEQETQVRFVRKAAQNLTELVDDLLDLAKVEAGKTVVVPSEFTVNAIFGTLRGMLRPLLVGEAVALVFEDASDLTLLDTDEGKVSQILRNFISNALKFTESGEVRVWATDDAQTDTVTFNVRDTGIGIAPGDIELIFQEFGQVTHRLQSRVKGTGLGLPLAKTLAELLGGNIAVVSTPGKGSTFSVTLPRVFPREADEAEIHESWSLDPTKVPILFVEDNPADAFAIERILADTPYQALRAQTVRQAQLMLEQIHPAAILLDVVLLGDESWRLVLLLRQDEARADIPLIVTSSSGDARKAIHLGADEYLAKPVVGEVLIGLLDRLTGRRSITNVLLVDDEEIARYLVRQLLPRSRYSVSAVSSGSEGLQRLRDARPDIVLLDINMPEMSGYEFLAHINDDARIADVPVIVLTSAILVPTERTLLHRASRILSKSDLSTDMLTDTIESVLDRPQPMLADERRGTPDLVVDDDAGGRYLKAHILRKNGYDVVEAASGLAAIAQCEVNVPDLGLVDMHLPDIHGVDVCRQLKADFSGIAILQTSAAITSPHDRVLALDGGADGFLVEPIEPEELLATVKALLRMRGAEQALRQVNETLENIVAERTKELTESNRRLEIESAERRKAEDVLWHTQKLEAVGELTGGIAHDFNNLLAVIVLSMEMIRAAFNDENRELPRSKILRLLTASEVATDRATKLTQQLLAFARRSTLKLGVVILNEVIVGCEPFLRRALGETIAVDLRFEQDLWPCRIDATQFESAMLNLVVNARDAMPSGGRVEIITSNVAIDAAEALRLGGLAAGSYVLIRLTDTGTGMDADVAARAFEPFFTTKDVGKGTGLGLSQVYGFIKQSGGQINIDTKLGRGTIFCLYSPRCEPVEPAAQSQSETAQMPPTGNETVLVVEDNPEVLELAVNTISELGYHVLTAVDGPSALEIIQTEQPIDLLFSDVVMPGGMNGFDLINKARAMRGELKALATSGYANIHRPGTERPDVPLLLKPYHLGDLAKCIRMALDQR